MKAEEISLAQFIGEKAKFIIPVYQRNYDWKKSNCQRLFDDMKNIVKNGKPHFLGTIVYQAINNGYSSEYIIIDGQQRITSVILLAKVLCEVIGDPEIKDTLVSTFIKHSAGELKNQFRLKLSEYDTGVFQKLMASEKFSSDEFNATEKSSALYANYKFFLDELRNVNYDLEKIYRALSQFKVVRICLDKENPQEIFESLNSTGLDLSNADLIRNYLLMALDYESQERLYKKYWLKIELLLKSSDVVENFMVQYLITKRRSDSITDEKKSRLSKNNLYYSFKNYFAENYKRNSKDEDVENFLEDMYRYAEIYRRFIFSESTDFKSLSPLEKKFYELTFLLDATNAPIILMYLYDRYERKNFDESTFLKCVEALISLTFRAKVCSSGGIISAQFAGNVINKLDKNRTEILDENFFWQVLTFGKGKYAFPRDEEFKQALINENLYANLKKDVCKYFLYSLEKFNGSDNLPAYSNTVVEHIIPQRLNKDWRNYLQAQNELHTHELSVQTLGNLVLTVADEKIEWETFDAKKVRFIDSKFFYTKDVAKFAGINSKQIQARAKKIANVAVQIWTLPEKFNEQLKNLENVYSLDYDDFEIFKGKKPSTISILNDEKKISSWKDLIIEVLKQLHSLDADTFRLATRADNVSRIFSTTPENLRDVEKIDDDVYMECNLDTPTRLRMLKRIAENFDETSGTNIKDEIWFTLK